MTGQPATLRAGWTGLQVGNNGAAADRVIAALTGILDSIEVPIVVIQRDMTMAAFNQAAADLLGLSLSDIGRTLGEISVLAGLPGLEQCCTEVITGRVESRIDVRDGEVWFVARISPYKCEDDKVGGTVLTFTNVTAFRAAVDQAVYERECTRAILNTVADPLVVVGADQRVQSGNRSFYTMFGVSPDETQRTSLYELGNGAFDSAPLQTPAPSSGRGLEPGRAQEVLAGGHAFRPVEVDHVVTAQGERTLVVDSRPLSFPGRSERRALVRFQDITARKQAEAAKDLRSEEELRRSEAFLAEGQRLSSTGSFSWNAWRRTKSRGRKQLYRIYEVEIGVPVTLERIRARSIRKTSPCSRTWSNRRTRCMNDFEWQYRLLMPDRSIKYLHAVAHATRDQDGQLEYIAAIQDVTAAPNVSEEALGEGSIGTGERGQGRRASER